MAAFINTRDIPNESCVYCISNTINDKVYIGSAKSVKERMIRHKYHLNKNKHNNSKLQRFVNKYGINTLNVEILEKCAVEVLLEREQYYLDTLKPWYNILLYATSRYGIPCNANTKLLIGKANTGMRNGNAKLNEVEVMEIRNSSKTCKILGELYNISPSQICLVKNYKSYKNIK